MKIANFTLHTTLCCAAFLAFAVSSPSFSAEASGGLSEGSKCTVTSGPNGGKSGTVTVETDDDGGSHTWCEGTWGGTECSGNKCAAAFISFNGGNRLLPVTGAPVFGGSVIGSSPVRATPTLAQFGRPLVITR
jgi:hypothetical protein